MQRRVAGAVDAVDAVLGPLGRLGRSTRDSRRPRAEPHPLRAALADLGDAAVDLVVVSSRAGAALANELARAHPSATIHLLTSRRLPNARVARLHRNVVHAACQTVPARLAHLARVPQPYAIIDKGLRPVEDRVQTFRELFGLVVASGRYVLEAPSSTDDQDALAEFFTELRAAADCPPVSASDFATELGMSASGIERIDGGWIVTKRFAHQWKLRDRRATKILTRRFGSAWGEVVAQKPALSFASRARVELSGESFRPLPVMIGVPDRWLRRYREPVCYTRKRVRMGDFWLPDTFRSVGMRVLSHRVLNSASPLMARLREPTELPTRRAEGAFYYLDSEYYSHFGHVLTDVVSNAWGWHLARERSPDVRPLVSLPADQAGVPDFQRRIFSALDIDPDTIAYVRPDAGLVVDELYGATADFSNPRYAAPELAAVWDRIRRHLAGDGVPADTGNTPRRLFVARTARETRTCRNATEVEDLFAGLGFTVIYPETLDFAAQVVLFSRAQVIAGFAGSGMLNAMFSPQSTLLVITGTSFRAINEYLIKAVNGGDIHYFCARSEIPQPERGFTWEAFRSNFTFDVARHRARIEQVVSSLPE